MTGEEVAEDRLRFYDLILHLRIITVPLDVVSVFILSYGTPPGVGDGVRNDAPPSRGYYFLPFVVLGICLFCRCVVNVFCQKRNVTDKTILVEQLVENISRRRASVVVNDGDDTAGTALNGKNLGFRTLKWLGFIFCLEVYTLDNS